MKLDDIAGLIAANTQFDDALEPRLRYLPRLVLLVPLRLDVAIVTQPLAVANCIRDLYEERKRPLATKYHRNRALAPNASRRVLTFIARRWRGHDAA
jgi:hypothetical protein